jgi:ABC-type polar amino acid transport system ATPase subunit
MDSYPLKRLRFRSGPAPGAEGLTVSTGAVTVLVGPNNSGKSLTLRELEHACKNADPQLQVLASVEPRTFENVEALKTFLEPAHRPRPQGASASEEYYGLPGTEHRGLNPFVFQTALSDQKWLMWLIGGTFAIRFDGATRLQLLKQEQGGDLTQAPTNTLQALFQNAATRARLSEIMYDAFGLHFVIDPTHLGNLRARLSRRKPASEDEEQGLTSRSRDFHREAPLIETFSDGVRAYAGILAATMGALYKLILIDEPEAFLHPPLARKLGFNLARLARERDANVIAATHSSDFVMGCVESGVEVQIVRLTYELGVATARHLPAEALRGFMKDPLPRSANVLSGVFHDSVVVTESDADRAFYAEVNQRLLAHGARGARGCLFLNAQNKQTLYRLVGPLRRVGVPAACIVDVDVLKEGGIVFTNLLKAAQIPVLRHEALANTRAKLLGAFNATGKDFKRNGGVGLLQGDEAQGCRDFFGELGEYGVFVVPGGELESWLKPLGVGRHGPEWLIEMFTRMGSDPDSGDYVRPTEGDVWTFIQEVAAWVSNPRRKGVAPQ